MRETPTAFPSVGATRIIDSLAEAGYREVGFYNLDLLRSSEDEIISYFLQNRPDIVGISAVVSTSYRYVKRLTQLLKLHLPHIYVILGGNMAVSAEVLLRKCSIDICVIGEGIDTIVELARYFEKYKTLEPGDGLRRIKGIAYIEGSDKDRLLFTGNRAPVVPERLRQPNYDILGSHYITDPYKRPDFKRDPRSKESHRRGKKAVVFELSKGCVSRCTFCHRWVEGYRIFNIDSMIENIKYLMKRFNIGFVNFMDENFGVNQAYLQEFCEKIKPLDILWHVGGMRVRSVDADIFKKMRDSGCVSIYFGIESGSDKMLKIIEKGVTVEDNLKALRAVKEAGLFTVIQLVIGMPGENSRTIKETIEFIRRAREILGEVELSTNYAQTLPGTPLYEYARLKGFIGKTLDEEEEYLLKISDTEAAEERHFINMTEDKISNVYLWRYLIQREAYSNGKDMGSISKRHKFLAILRRFFGEAFSLFLVKVWKCYSASNSLRGALALLCDSKKEKENIKPESLRRTVRELRERGIV